MKAPIPSRNSSWWNDTGDQRILCFCNPPKNIRQGRCCVPGCESQGERWWNDERLDEKAAQILAHHAHRNPTTPWFVDSNTTEQSGDDEEAWLSEWELEQLEDRGDLYTIKKYYDDPWPHESAPIGPLTVPKPLLISFSRRLKETNLHPNCRGCLRLEISPKMWYSYVGCQWYYGQWCKEGTDDRPRWKLPKKEQMGSHAQLMKATATFFEWMKTGKVVLEVDDFVNKEYLLELARALGAPLFRAAILEQMD